MTDRSTRVVLVGIFVLLAVIAAQLHDRNLKWEASATRAGAGSSPLADAERSIVDLFERVSASIVQVSTISGAGDPSNAGIKIGSGFIWDTSGNIVTNEHVVKGADTITVWLGSGEPLDAEVVGAAPNHDLAVIRLKSTRALPPPIPLGDSKSLKVGQFAYAIGSPFGLDQSLTTGVISALKRQLPTGKGWEIAEIIQTDAAIYPGNSGGPLLDSSGRLIGVNTISYSLARSHGTLGFAIPVDLVKRIIPELVRSGRIPTPGIGVIPGDQTAAMSARIDGVGIARIRPGSPAERAGLQGTDASTGKLGDIITNANGHPIRSVFDLTKQLERVGIGKRIELIINRNGRLISLDIEIVDIDRTPS